MSSSMHIVGFRPPNEKWKLMKTVWDACAKAGIEPSKEVLDFFGGDPPDEQGVEIRLQYLPKPGGGTMMHECVKEFRDDCCDGFEVDVKKLPKDLTILRIYISY